MTSKRMDEEVDGVGGCLRAGIPYSGYGSWTDDVHSGTGG